VRSYTTTNTSETEVFLTGLQCDTTYYIRVAVAGVLSLAIGVLESDEVQVFVGGSLTGLCVVHSEKTTVV